MDATKPTSQQRGGVSHRSHPVYSIGAPHLEDGSPSSTEKAAVLPENGSRECHPVLLLNSSGRVVGASDEALRIAGGPLRARGLDSLRDACAARAGKGSDAGDRPGAGCPWSAGFQVGELAYRCQAVSLRPPSRHSAPGHTVMLFERVRTRGSALSRLCADYRLTRRELETIDLLVLGLTNKEIADRLGLSCNTVKAFLRSVMAKLRISTRAGIIGALVARMG